MINPEVKSFTLAQELTLPDSLPKPLGEYPPVVQRYMELAARQKCGPEIQKSLVTVAVMVYGICEPTRKSGLQGDMAVLTIEDAAQILNITEDLVRRHYDLVLQTDPSAWEEFERDLRLLKRQSTLKKRNRLERKERIIELRQQDQTIPQIAGTLRISTTTVNKDLSELFEENKTPRKPGPRRTVETEIPDKPDSKMAA